VTGYIGRDRTLGGAIDWMATYRAHGISAMTSDTDKMTYDIGEIDITVTEYI
jgi:hypothetical protein